MAKTPRRQTRQTPDNLPRRYSSYNPKADLNEAGLDGPAVEPQPKRHFLKRIVVWCLLILLAASLLIGIWDVRNISSAEKKMFGTGDVKSLINSGSIARDSNGMVDMLVAGYSADDPGHSGANLTDSIMLISINPINHHGYMLSIPRDFYVKLGSNNCQSGYEYCKINEAYEDGGMPLLEKAVGTVLGVNIQYYALVDYSAVKDITDAVGGINVTINSPDGRLYDPNRDYATHAPLVDLANGTHHLNGEQALDLSRARGDTDTLAYGSPQPIGFEQNDYQRTQDQRLIFAAIKQKMNWKLILNPAKNNAILNAAANNVRTNLQASDALPFFRSFNSIPSNQMQSLSLNKINGVTLVEGSDYDGSTQTPVAGIDDYSQIQSVINQLSQ